MHGADSLLRQTREMISEISSKVPVPPGKAMKASPSSIILRRRSGMSSVTISRVRPGSCASLSMKNCGSTPITSPPAARVAMASSPMRPTFEPP